MLDAFVFEPFSVNQQIIDSLLMDPDQFEVWIRSELGGGDPGTGTVCDPYDGSSQTKFDSLMASFQPNTTIHLGPGTFQTNGSNGGWNPKSGWRIVGAGFDETILMLVNASSTSTLTTAIGAPSTNFLNGFEASDFTVDCNPGGQSAAACGAISVAGSHIYIHRIRVINFGTQAAAVKGAAIVVGNADPSTPEVFDCVIEECIIEQPSPDNVRETTCLGIGAKEDANGVMAYHRACVIRNCYIDCAYTNSPRIITGITFSGTTATVTTQIAHGLSSSQWVVVTGALENGVLSTNYNGSFQVTVLNATQFTYTMPGTPTAQPTGQMSIRSPASQRVAIQSISRSGGGSNWTVTLNTSPPHNRVLGSNPNNVAVNGATPGGYNGVFAITAIPSPTQLQYALASDPGAPGATNAYIGADFRAIEADGGIGTIIEDNQIHNCLFGCYHDSYSSKDTVIRNNCFRGVNTAIYQKMGGVSGGDSSQNPTRLGASLTRVGTTATFTTVQPHGLSIGQAVVIAGATQAPYNGTFAVASVPSPTSFTYVMSSDPGSSASGSFAFGALWQVGRLIVQDNVIELILNVIASGWEAPVGINLYDSVGSHGSQFVFQQVIVRGNIIRHVDNASDASQKPMAIYLDSCLNAIVENNDINLDAPKPIRHYTVGTAKYFNNESPGGNLIQGASYTKSGSYSVLIYAGDTFNQSVNELTTDADLAATLAT